jgi:hypothetical protein
MPRRFMLAACAAVFCCALGSGARAQSADDRHFEIGGQFSVLNATNGRGSVTTAVPCSPSPCTPGTTTTTTDGRATEPGFGGRVGFNFNRYFGVEAEGNFFPRERGVREDDFNGGRKTQGLFGVKVGRHFEEVGVFVKARPGFVHFNEGNLRQPPDTVCILIVPAPVGCFETTGRTDFAFDLGGVVELYPSHRTIIRFDAGDTILRTDAHLIPVTIPTQGTAVTISPRDTTHNFQGSIGVGWRF